MTPPYFLWIYHIVFFCSLTLKKINPNKVIMHRYILNFLIFSQIYCVVYEIICDFIFNMSYFFEYSILQKNTALSDGNAAGRIRTRIPFRAGCFQDSCSTNWATAAYGVQRIRTSGSSWISGLAIRRNQPLCQHSKALPTGFEPADTRSVVARLIH